MTKVETEDQPTQTLPPPQNDNEGNFLVEIQLSYRCLRLMKFATFHFTGAMDQAIYYSEGTFLL